MNTIVENLTGMQNMTDQVIANDLLNSAKTGIRNCAIALTETATPQVRTVLRRQLEDAINQHEEITKYMMAREWYHAYDPQEQLRLDMKNANTALNLPS